MGLKNQKKAHKPSGKLGRRARKQQEGKTKVQRLPVTHSNGSCGKAQRRQASLLKRQQARAAELDIRRRPGPPVVVGLLPLSQAVNAHHLRSTILAACQQLGKDAEMLPTELLNSEENCIAQLPGVRKTKWNLLPVLQDNKDMLSLVEYLCAVELLVLVADGNGDAPPIDMMGMSRLQLLRSLGLPSAVCVIQGSNLGEPKENSAAKKRVTEVLKDELNSGVRAYIVMNSSECESMLHHLQPQKMSIPAWRRSRPSILVDSVYIEEEKLHVRGYIRNQSLSANQVISLPGVGDFQMSCIKSAVDPLPVGVDVGRTIDTAMETVLDKPNPEMQHPIVQENDIPEDTEDANDIELPDVMPMVAKRVPKGTSEYQAAWILEDDELITTESEMEELDESLDEHQLKEIEDVGMDSRSIGGATSIAQSDIDSDDVGWDEAADLQAMESLKTAEKDERVFPDEVEVPADSSARTRFAAYRGLKSFRTSPWDAQENLPRDYARVFAFENFRNACKRFRTEKGGVASGQYVALALEDIDSDLTKIVMERVVASGTGAAPPLIAYGLLKHETKMSVVNFRVRKMVTYENPIANREEFFIMTGMRKFSARPLFSTDNPSCDKHKMEKFLSPDSHSFATFYANVGFPPLPLLAFKIRDGKPELAFSGSLQSCDPDRVVLKKIILTGKPGAVKKKTCVVVGMFHDPEDARWFKPLGLWTKYGRSGYIKESLGTHGAFKAYFDGSVQQRDTICMSLYKRVFPVWPYQQKDDSMIE